MLITGLIDGGVQKEVLGGADLDSKDGKETATLIKTKEIVHDALMK